MAITYPFEWLVAVYTPLLVHAEVAVGAEEDVVLGGPECLLEEGHLAGGALETGQLPT